VLTGAAHNRQSLTYTLLADRIGMGAGTLSGSLDLVMRYCHRNELPPLTVLVVNQETGLPGAGLSTLEEVNRDRERVFNYPWAKRFPVQISDFGATGAPSGFLTQTRPGHEEQIA
ncbi:MAG TPA: hypothetical protein VFA18_24345, partial [Gemmataceae bacterium]|nr:hypothetical protein [Gemmataceae bacterium]